MKLIVAAALSLCAFGAQATLFYGQDVNAPNGQPTPNADAAFSDFISGLTHYGIDSFESVAPGTNAYNTPIGLSFGNGLTANLSGAGVVLDEQRNGRYALDGDQYYNVAGTFTIEFSRAVNAFGFFGIDINDVGGVLSVSLDDNPTTREIESSFGSTNVLFWGITSPNPFTSITFYNSSGAVRASDGFGFDQLVAQAMSIPAAVSAPSTWGFSGLLAGVALFLRKRRQGC